MHSDLLLRVLSATADMITGGDALIEVSSPGESVAVQLNGIDVTTQLTPKARGVWQGVVTGFNLGENVLAATAGDEHRRLRVSNHPIEGPLFSGPHLQPWRITTEDNGLGPALDVHGNAAFRFDWHFMSTETGTFESYDPQSPPPATQIATATTDQGVSVPYIVRRETGAANRGIYELAVLCDPEQPWTAVAPQDGWNHKLWIYAYGGWYQLWSQSVFTLSTFDAGPDGPSPELSSVIAARQKSFKQVPQATVLNDMGLRRGFMIARTTFMQSATNSDTVRAAESLVMLKEHIIKRYGQIRYTFSTGASGGSIMQYMIANQYPGILDGIIPMSSLQGTWYLENRITETHLLTNYFTKTAPQLWSEAADRLAVDGHRSEEFNVVINDVFIKLGGSGNPRRGTNLVAGQTYHPDTNPGGARATLQDYQVNYLGRRSRGEWTRPEREIGAGFAQRPFDNVGVQYGLQALLDKTISVEQFVDLNTRIGSLDIDGELVADRAAASADSVERLNRTGLHNDFANMDTVAILDFRPPETEEGIASHTQYHTWIARQALIAAHGHADNQVVWMVPGFFSLVPTEAAFEAMDRWLSAIEADTSDQPLSRKVVANKPADLVDGVIDENGSQIGDLAYLHCIYPSYGDPRTVAGCGDPAVYATFKPQLKPLDVADYPGIEFTPEQWERLQTTFPDGVADWTRPGVGQTPSVPWLDYANGPGGQPLH